MRRRRELLGTVATGAIGALAGCSECGETWYAHRLRFEVTDVDRAGGGWNLSVTASLEFEFPTSDDDGIGQFDVALYGADRSLLDHAMVGGLYWGDVPAADRRETDCGNHGTLTVSESFTVAELPRYVGPRFHDAEDAASLHPNGSSGFRELRAIRYAGGDARSRTSTSAETGTATPTATRDDDTTETISPADFEPVDVERLPWPEPDNQAARETDALTNVRFRTTPSCVSRDGVGTTTGLFDADLTVEWARAIPEGSCERPFLRSVSFEDERLSATVGLHEAPQVRCRGCERVGYELLVDRREDRDVRFEEVELLHLSGDGEVVERIVELVGD